MPLSGSGLRARSSICALNVLTKKRSEQVKEERMGSNMIDEFGDVAHLGTTLPEPIEEPMGERP
jgi:hypothetical protein